MKIGRVEFLSGFHKHNGLPIIEVGVNDEMILWFALGSVTDVASEVEFKIFLKTQLEAKKLEHGLSPSELKLIKNVLEALVRSTKPSAK